MELAPGVGFEPTRAEGPMATTSSPYVPRSIWDLEAIAIPLGDPGVPSKNLRWKA